MAALIKLVAELIKLRNMIITRVKKFLICSVLLMCLSSFVGLSQAENPFQLIFIDEKTESKMGSFPYDRKIYAEALNLLKKYEAKAVVLKYFLDLPKTNDGDKLLSDAMKNIPVFLQANIDNKETVPNPLPEKFFYNDFHLNRGLLIQGKSGWIPLPIFSENCYQIGFVNIRNIDAVPLIEVYRGYPVKTLYLEILEYVIASKVDFNSLKEIKINKRNIQLTEYSEITVELPTVDHLQYISFVDLIEGKVQKKDVANKVIILGYDGEKIHSFDTKIGKIKAHRMFYYGLIGAYKKIS